MAAGAGQPANSFGGLLRQLRDEAGLTQEQLAEAATLSPRSISDLERDIGHVRGQAHAFMVLANLHTGACNYRTAVAYAQQALAGFRDIGELGLEGGILNLLGSLQLEMGDYAAATMSLRRAQTVSDDLAGAEANHKAALKIFTAVSECDGQARALNSLGELAARTADGRQAHEYFSQALALAPEGSTPLEEARALAGIGQLHLHNGNTSDAVPQLEQALAIYRRIPVAQASRIEEILSSVRAGKPV